MIKLYSNIIYDNRIYQQKSNFVDYSEALMKLVQLSNIDNYGHKEYSETRRTIESFFEEKKVEFLQYMTGQAMIIKKH